MSRVSSENLVSPLRFTGQSDLTHGFLTRNEPDALDVITQFVSHEKALPFPGPIWNDLHSRLVDAKGTFHYQFPKDLMDGRYLLMECPTVCVEQCTGGQYVVRFGCGFENPELCGKIQHPALPIKKLVFEPECISHCDGLKAVSESATVRALHSHLNKSSCTIDSSERCSLVFDYKDTSYSTTVEFFELVCPATAKTQRTAQGLLVIPHAEMDSDYATHIISISITTKPNGSTVTPEAMHDGVNHLGSLIKDSMEKLFGKKSPDRLLSVSEFID